MSQKYVKDYTSDLLFLSRFCLMKKRFLWFKKCPFFCHNERLHKRFFSFFFFLKIFECDFFSWKIPVTGRALCFNKHYTSCLHVADFVTKWCFFFKNFYFIWTKRGWLNKPWCLEKSICVIIFFLRWFFMHILNIQYRIFIFLSFQPHRFSFFFFQNEIFSCTRFFSNRITLFVPEIIIFFLFFKKSPFSCFSLFFMYYAICHVVNCTKKHHFFDDLHRFFFRFFFKNIFQKKTKARHVIYKKTIFSRPLSILIFFLWNRFCPFFSFSTISRFSTTITQLFIHFPSPIVFSPFFFWIFFLNFFLRRGELTVFSEIIFHAFWMVFLCF